MSAELYQVESRARVHAALGGPIRLRIVDALVLGDASPSELGAELGMASNLLAHHLRVLTKAGVIERAHSEADRRRWYVRLVPEALAVLTPPSPPLAAHRVVFVCTRNTARSQLAAALWARRSRMPATSAGTDPGPQVHPRAVATARRHGLSLERGRPRRLAGMTPGDLVVAVCDNAYEQLARDARAGESRSALHWSVPDPVPVGTDDAFETAFTRLRSRVDRLAPALDAGATTPPDPRDRSVP